MLQNPSSRDDSAATKNPMPPRTPIGEAANDGSIELDDNATQAFVKLEVSASTIERVATRLQRGQLLLKDARRLAIALSFMEAARRELEHACGANPRLICYLHEKDLFR
jgi:hypothetical protein